MLLRRAVVLCCSVLFAPFFASAQTATFTGTWSGSVSGSVNCNGSRPAVTGSATAAFIQSGNLVSGSVTLSLQGTCADGGSEVDVVPVSGTISGATVTGVFVPRGDRFTYAVSVNGSTMTVSLASDDASISGTLQQTSAQPPDSTLTGTYTGTYVQTLVPCGGELPPLTYGGEITLRLTQIGPVVTGSLTLADQKSDEKLPDEPCRIVDEGTVTASLVAQIIGSALNGDLTAEKATGVITGTVSGATISGSITGDSGVAGESMTFNVTRTSSAPPVPSIVGFTATPSVINQGGTSTLSWSTLNAATVSIDPGPGAQPLTGSVDVAPTRSTTYTLTATGITGTSTATATVTVPGEGPQIVAATFPVGMLQATGEGSATDDFSIANVGTEPANVSLTKSGSFFSIAPSSFTLQAGKSELVAITASTQSAGSYDGTITINGDGVVTGGISIPVHLLVADAPAGSVRPQPETVRVDVSAPEGQNPSGFVAFTNNGSAMLNGIAVEDVPWIVPQHGTITINPGETKNVTFSIDRSRRADAASLLGSATGSISLRFLGSATAANAGISATTPTSRVTVTIVDVVKPTVAPGGPPALGQGELALFVAGHASTEGLAGDLLLTNRTATTLTDVRLYLPQSSQFASISQLAGNLGITLPSVSTSVFGVDGASGLMIRGPVQSLAVGALRMITASGSAAYTSSIPVFRSDGGVAPGGRIVLSGVDRSATARTIIVLQELSGNAGSVELQGYDANGAPVGAKLPITLAGFVSVTDDGLAVVEGMRSIVITNTGSGSSRVNAYARVRSISTADVWIVVDPTLLPGSDTMILPMIATPGAAAQTDIYVTNTKNTAVTATLNVVNVSERRRAVRAHSASDPNPESSQTLSLGALGTKVTTMTPSNGYIRLTGDVGAISASARVTMTSSGTTFGSALPVLPASSALGDGQLKRFSGVGDSSARTIAAKTPATFRSSLMLIETAGQSAEVRVTVWYSLTGSRATSRTSSFRDFSLRPNQMMVVSDLARKVIGGQRDAFGDLRDTQVDVQVVGGSGRVLSYVTSIDNGSGDVVIRD